GRLSGRGYELGGRELTLTAADGSALQPTSFNLEVEDASPGGPGVPATPARGRLSASLLELGPLSGLAEALPFPAELRARLAELGPQGRLRELRFDWRGTLPQAADYTARARFEALGMNAWGRVPGFAGLSGRIEATPARGSVELDARGAKIDLPKVFPEPRIALDTLTLRMDWTRAAGVLQVRLGTVNFSNAHLAGNAFGSYRHDGEGPGVVDLTAQIARADGRHTAKYLPLAALMGVQTRGWLEAAILGGELTETRLRLQGDLREFPFLDPARGQFLVTARVRHGQLAYASGWPQIRDIEGELQFERNRMEIIGRGGSIFGAKLSAVRVGIPNLGAAHPELLVSGQAEGPSQEFLRYVAESPVDRMTGGFTQGMKAAGRARLKLNLKLPLDALDRTKVTGEIQFADNVVHVHSRLPPIERAAGRLAFTESGFLIPEVQGRLFEGPVTLRGGTQAAGHLRVTAEGEATVGGMRTLFDHAWRTRLSGASRYTGTLSVEDGRTRIRFESMLRGVASSLPPPLTKRAEEELPLRVDVLPSEGGARDRISVLLGQRLAAEFLRHRENDRMQVTRTAVALNPAPGATLRLPDRDGTLMYGTLEALDLDRWLPLLVSEAPAQATGTTPAASAAQAAAPGALKPPAKPAALPAKPAAGPAKPAPATAETAGGGNSIFELRAGTLDVFGKRLSGVTLKAGADAGGWSANVEAQELAGDLAYRSQGFGRLTARLAHFRVPDDAPGARAGEGPRDLPSVDLVAERFTLRGKALGRVEVVAQQLGPEWRIDRLALVNPDAALHGKGAWRTVLSAVPGGPSSSRTALEFELDVSDVGKFLERIGYPALVREGQAKLGGNVAWNAGPTTLDYPSLNGKLRLEADDGQFLEIEPGIGKLVSLMSLQMLPRRIALDFRDVFSKGFKWDRITSALEVERGVLATKDFRMRGPAAEVEMAGTTNLAVEMQDLKVRVIPNFGDTASTVVGFVNPVVGLATMIASRVLKNPLGKILAYDYTIKGSWSDPKIERVVVEQRVIEDQFGTPRPVETPAAPAPVKPPASAAPAKPAAKDGAPAPAQGPAN
ncbi:MAG TPA: YhdP family protein, partial [Burkholderiales bacterium]